MSRKQGATPQETMQKPLFHPTFGSRPAQIVGRDHILERFLEGLQDPIGSRSRCLFLIGQRGMGKTALLLEMADLAKEHNMVPALVTVYEDMNTEIIETLQRNAQSLIVGDNRTVQGFEVGALGFSLGLSFSDAREKNYGFRTQLTLLCEQLEKYGKGVLLLVDETNNSDSMRQLGITYQHLVGENRNIVIVMAGLPQAVSSVLNDRVLTFLNRAEKENLGPISLSSIRAYYQMAFEKEGIRISEELLDEAVSATGGYPYLMQLIGYYLVRYARNEKTIGTEELQEARKAAMQDLGENVFQPILLPLSNWDRAFLRAMAVDDGQSSMTEIGARLGKKNSFLQPYRARLISAGIIEAPRKGYVEFSMPYLADYLRSSE